MKKIIALLLALLMLFSLAACDADPVKYKTLNVYSFSNVLPIGHYNASTSSIPRPGISNDRGKLYAEPKLYTKTELAKLEETEESEEFYYFFNSKQIAKDFLREYYVKLVKNEDCASCTYTYENGTTVTVEFEEKDLKDREIESFIVTLGDVKRSNSNESSKIFMNTIEGSIEEYNDQYVITIHLGGLV